MGWQVCKLQQRHGDTSVAAGGCPRSSSSQKEGNRCRTPPGSRCNFPVLGTSLFRREGMDGGEVGMTTKRKCESGEHKRV